MTDELATLDATAQAALVRRGDVSPVELVDAAIARIESLDGELNAVVLRRFDAARAEAQEASNADADGDAIVFRGVPFLTKDLACPTAGEPQTDGMRALLESGWTARETSHLARRFRRAGLVNLGRTNSPELGLVPTTEPAAWGPTRNPWDPTRSPGGSSGGSAAAVAAGLVPVAHASDGGGSIRIPASVCGLVGLKTSRGRVSVGPGRGELTSFLSVQFAVTRTVRDAAALLDVCAGEEPGDPVIAPPPARTLRERDRARARSTADRPDEPRAGRCEPRARGMRARRRGDSNAARDARPHRRGVTPGRLRRPVTLADLRPDLERERGRAARRVGQGARAAVDRGRRRAGHVADGERRPRRHRDRSRRRPEHDAALDARDGRMVGGGLRPPAHTDARRAAGPVGNVQRPRRPVGRHLPRRRRSPPSLPRST